jgi:hypothetical protein
MSVYSECILSQARWYLFVRRLTQEGECKASLGYIARPHLKKIKTKNKYI